MFRVEGGCGPLAFLRESERGSRMRDRNISCCNTPGLPRATPVSLRPIEVGYIISYATQGVLDLPASMNPRNNSDEDHPGLRSAMPSWPSAYGPDGSAIVLRRASCRPKRREYQFPSLL